jgi:hypothetical protein
MVVDNHHENRDLSGERSAVNMKTTNSLRAGASRFFGDRYAYRAQPNYLSELVAFGVIAATVVWPILLLAHAMATT